MRFETKELPTNHDYLAPDGSEIRLMPDMNGGGLAHCTLPPGGASKPVYHRTVEEIWYGLTGQGQVWRKLESQEEVVDFFSGIGLTIPVGTQFQFRNTGAEPLQFIIVTMPPWPGPEEAVPLDDGKWQVQQQ